MTSEGRAGNSVASQHDDSLVVSLPQETPIHASVQAAEQGTSIRASMHQCTKQKMTRHWTHQQSRMTLINE